MGYNIGQHRCSGIAADYATELTVGNREFIPTSEDSTMAFYENQFRLSGSSVTSFDNNNSYNLIFTVKKRMDSQQSIVVKLYDDAGNTDELKTVTVPMGEGDLATYEITFTPDAVYNSIRFELNRISGDYAIENDVYTDDKGVETDEVIVPGSAGRIAITEIVKLTLLKNVLDIIGVSQIFKLGIQGPQGMVFIIDGEEIRIGKSGIYELYNDTLSINYIGFVLKEHTYINAENKEQTDLDFFIMDYKY